MVLYLYSAFLVLMTTQSALQYSFTFTHSHTHSYSASISSTFFVLWGAIQGLASCPRTLRQADGEYWGSNCRLSGWRTTTLLLSHSRPVMNWLCSIMSAWCSAHFNTESWLWASHLHVVLSTKCVSHFSWRLNAASVNQTNTKLLHVLIRSW